MMETLRGCKNNYLRMSWIDSTPFECTISQNDTVTEVFNGGLMKSDSDLPENVHDFADQILNTKSDIQRVRDKNVQISYYSKNHAIKALNTFMKHLHSEGIVQIYHSCEPFDESKLRERTIDDVISDLVEAGLIKVILTLKPVITYKCRLSV